MERFFVSAPPHIRTTEDTRTIMLDVIVALMPALVAATYFFGYRAAIVAAVSVFSAVLFEHGWQVLLKRPTTVGDGSTVVSGLLLAFNLPASVPLWLPVAGSFFMIVIVKQCFGGIGQNIVNPALAARAFLMASWPAAVTFFPEVFARLTWLVPADALSAATPLRMANQPLPLYRDLLLGNVSGCMGETSAVALLVGGLYLLVRKVIRWHIPTTYIGTVALFCAMFGSGLTGDALYQVLSGGLLLGAIFMATDYTTSPMTGRGQAIYGVGCGLITCIIRFWGGYPEGVSYAILLMNVATPLIDKATAPRRFGREALQRV